jgi:hypothetical protein
MTQSVIRWWHAEGCTRWTGDDSFDSGRLNYMVEMFPGEMMG